MLRKILVIAHKDLYLTYTDRNLLLIMLVTPLVLATIISLAFSSFFTGNSDVPIRDIPLAIANMDAGAVVNGVTMNSGQLLIDVFVPPADASDELLASNVVYTLTNAVLVGSEAEARAGVDDGTYNVAILIPANFSAALSTDASGQIVGGASVTVYGSAAAPLSSNIIRSVVTGVNERITAGNIAAAATIGALTARARQDPAFGVSLLAAQASGGFNPDFSAALANTANPIVIEQQAATSVEPSGFSPLVLFGAGQALFFMTFTAMGGSISLLEEQRDGTLPRLMTTPTPRWVLLLGKLLGTYLNCVVQVTLLFIALTLVGSVVAGEFQFIWGQNLPLIVLTVLLASFAACGIGALVMALVKTPEQGNVIGGVISLTLALFGGVFFDLTTTPLAPLARLTPNYWGVDAFTTLAQGGTDIGLNLLVLGLIGLILFTAGITIFNRRMALRG